MRPNSPYSTRAAGMSRRMTSILLTLAAMVTEEFAARSLTGSRNLPRSGLKPGKDIGEVKEGRWALADEGPQHAHYRFWAGWDAGQSRSGGHCAGSVPQRGL